MASFIVCVPENHTEHLGAELRKRWGADVSITHRFLTVWLQEADCAIAMQFAEGYISAVRYATAEAEFCAVG